MWLLLTFLALPIIEIALFIQVGGLIGLWPTLGLVILARCRRHLDHPRAGRAARSAGCRPASPPATIPSGRSRDGALILIAGMLLLIPGFFTDAIGLVLLIPAARRW